MNSKDNQNFDLDTAISDAFNKIVLDCNSKYYTAYWLKFFIEALFSCEEMPECFLNFNSSIACKKITDIITRLTSSFLIENNKILEKRFIKWSKILLKEAMLKFPDDNVLIIALGSIYEKNQEFDEAISLYKERYSKMNVNSESFFRLITKTLKNYRQQINTYRSLKKDTKQIREVMLDSYKNFKNLLQDELKQIDSNNPHYEFVSNNLDVIISEYAHELIKSKKFDEAYSVLTESTNNSASAYRKYTVMAYLYQNQYDDERNVYTNYQKTIDCCYKALSYFPNFETDKANKKAIIPILLTLMNTYAAIGNKEDAIKYACIIKNLQIKNSKADDILSKYDISKDQKREIIEKILTEAQGRTS